MEDRVAKAIAEKRENAGSRVRVVEPCEDDGSLDAPRKGEVLFAEGLEDDQPLSPAQCNFDGAGGARVPTPSGRRSKNGSRAHSRPKDERDLSPVKPANLLRPGSRPVSRKKERRWTNDQRIGAEMNDRDFKISNKNLAAYGLDSEEFDVNAAARLIFKQEFHSFFEGFTSEMRRQFLDFEGGFIGAGTANLQQHRTQRHQDLSTATARFASLDASLRQHLLQAGTREPFSTFLTDMERFLMNVLDQENASEKSILAYLTDMLSRTVEGVPTITKSKSNGPVVELIINSAFHRLLVHGLCRFHGLMSKSRNLKDGKRAIRVHNPRFDPVMAGWTLQDSGSEEEKSVLVIGGEPTVPLVPYLNELIELRSKRKC